jgi:two-component system, OmpR family, phosphate regulon sensor histidine kinase PhoR
MKRKGENAVLTIQGPAIKLRSTDPRIVSAILSFAVSLVSGLTIWAATWFSDVKLPILQISAIETMLFWVQYFLFKYFIEKFIYDKIKLIYKTIHSSKLTRETKKEILGSRKGNVIAQVEKEVLEWAIEHEKEMDEMKKLEEYRQQFLANVSHELKTPLFNIQGFTLSLLDGGLEDPSINRNYLLKTEKNVDRMITIVEDLEVISRLESGEIRPVFTRFAIFSLISEVLEFLEPKANQRNIRFIMKNEPGSMLMVYADKERIRQVLVNLIDNSIKYGKEGGRTKLSLYDMDENVLIEISDDGIGIDEEHISRLFERFYRVDKHRSRSAGGSGLGLAIVKHIIEAHGQTVNVRSADGVGSTFSFTLKKA